ncbi:MAG: hypothetical protein JWQ98_2491 [Chlorobi bacterium]|nr:hypothetical protein [Chlorobiota bacterium]
MKDELKNAGAPWWREMITRREAGGRIARIGATALLISTAGITIAGCGDKDDEEVQRDALDLQQKEGWNVGSTDKSLPYANKTGTSSSGTVDWNKYLDPATLLSAWSINDPRWQPYVVPTLVQSLAQQSLRGQIAPVYSRGMEEAYARGLGMKEILSKSKNKDNTMLVVDLPGPEAVAYAAALADVANPVITFDNWPHPLGVVHSQETLGAMVYYADEVATKAASRPKTAPAVLILDSNRLAPYTDEDSQFDNRYLAKIPTADRLKAMNISTVLYAVPDSSRTSELDDINEDFADYKSKGLAVSMVALSDFQPDKSDSTALATNGTTTIHHTYYYGGGPMYSPWFFYHYPVFVPSYSIPSRTSLPSTSLRGSSYTPALRPTMFSSRSTGGAKGVGKARPSGFGRVSTRVGSDGHTTGIRSGRSGSFGRSMGGHSS